MRWTFAAIAALVLLPGVAAHAVYLESDPSKGARLDAAPAEAWVRLTEPVDPDTYSFEVIDQDGAKASIGRPRLDAGPQARLSIAMKPDLPAGGYLMRWQVLSTADGHVTSGSTGFALGDVAPPASSTDDGDTQTSLLSPWARLASFLGLSLAAGALLFSMIGRRVEWTQPGLPRLLVIGCIVNTVGVLLLYFDTMWQSGLDMVEVARTGVGNVLVVRLVASFAALGVAETATKQGVIVPRTAATIAAVLLVSGAASARLGHASLAGASAILVDLLHLAGVTVWVGGLLVYWAILLRAGDRESTEGDVRTLGLAFGPVAMGCVVLLTITGLATTWTITRDYVPGLSLLDSAWGRFLAIKVALLVVMLTVAALNRHVLLGVKEGWPGRLGKPFSDWVGQVGPGGQRLRRTVQVEAIFGFGTLFLAALLTSISPPSTATATAATETEVEVEGTGTYYGFFGSWEQQPAAGTSTVLTIHIVNQHEGNLVANNTCGRDSCIMLELTPPGRGGVQVYTLQSIEGKRWQTEPILWVNPGFYQGVIKAQTSDVYLDEMPFDVRVE